MTDRYMKAVLTVIALALCSIAVQLATSSARAADLTNVRVEQPIAIFNGDKWAFSRQPVAVYCVNCH